MGGSRWRTVCTGSQELVGVICVQMGYIFEGNTRVINACTPLFRTYLLPTESTVAALNSFPPGAFPEYRLDCRQLSNGAWHCSPVEQQRDSFVELGVVCISYEEFYEHLRNRTLSTLLPPIECTPAMKEALHVLTFPPPSLLAALFLFFYKWLQ